VGLFDWYLIYIMAALKVLLAYDLAAADPIDAASIRIIDGDTIRIYDQRPDVRLVGFNAPESHRAICSAERELGEKASRRLHDIIRSSNLDFEFVKCSCLSGTFGTQRCNHGRRCGTLKANGRDVGSVLIAEGLAVPFECGKTRCPVTPRPWCN
jgi:endonuclease YncB( thermonuclease family)